MATRTVRMEEGLVFEMIEKAKGGNVTDGVREVIRERDRYHAELDDLKKRYDILVSAVTPSGPVTIRDSGFSTAAGKPSGSGMVGQHPVFAADEGYWKEFDRRLDKVIRTYAGS